MKQLTFLFLCVFTLGFVSCGEDNDSDNFEEQLAFDILQIDDYLTANNIDAVIHPSGIRYVDDTVGTGASPALSDTVTVKYTGTFFDESQFDASTAEVDFPLNVLIAAWQIMLPEMRAGGTRTLYAPSGYCYGARGSGSIPPNTNLIFQVELVGVK